jgi:hypothetical protein
MNYDLWDISARFFFDRFATEDEALTFVRALLDEYGEPYANDLELVIGEGGNQNLSGAALVALARSRAPRLDYAAEPNR